MMYNRRVRRLLVVVLSTLLLGVGFSAVSTPPAEAAVGCYGNWCSGMDPHATGCDRDAITVATAPITSGYSLGLQVGPFSASKAQEFGTLELRWSPRCQTNWARANIHRLAPYRLLFVEQNTGYTQLSNSIGGSLPGTNTGIFYTAMIYSPHLPARAVIENGAEALKTSWV